MTTKEGGGGHHGQRNQLESEKHNSLWRGADADQL